MLEFMERAWLQSKDPFAIIEGIEICQTWRQPLAEWLHNATLAAISKQIPPVEVRHHRERVMHYTRWWLVRELQKQDPAQLPPSKCRRHPRNSFSPNCYTGAHTVPFLSFRGANRQHRRDKPPGLRRA
jgi:hypothetical protein